jgi:hypothetical protein
MLQRKPTALVDAFMKARREAKTLSRIREKRYEQNFFRTSRKCMLEKKLKKILNVSVILREVPSR